MNWWTGFRDFNLLVVNRIIEVADITDRDLAVLTVSGINSDNPNVAIQEISNGIYELIYNKHNDSGDIEITFSFANTGLTSFENATVFAFTSNNASVSDSQEEAVSMNESGYLSPVDSKVVSSLTGDVDDIVLNVKKNFKNLYFTFFLYYGSSVKSRDIVKSIVNTVPIDVSLRIDGGYQDEDIVFYRTNNGKISLLQGYYTALVAVPDFKKIHDFIYKINDESFSYQQDEHNAPGEDWDNPNIYGGKSSNVNVSAGVHELSIIAKNKKANTIETRRDFILRVNNVFGSTNGQILGHYVPETQGYKIIGL